MADYETVQLRIDSSDRDDGTCIIYLAPEAEINDQDTNDTINQGLPEKPARVRDLNRVKNTVTVQGTFKPSDDLPSDHASALESLFDHSPVSAEDQLHRLRAYTTWSLTEGRLIDLYTQNANYNQSSISTTTDGSGNQYSDDVMNGDYPSGVINEIRASQPSGRGGEISYTIKLDIGIE